MQSDFHFVILFFKYIQTNIKLMERFYRIKYHVTCSRFVFIAMQYQGGEGGWVHHCCNSIYALIIALLDL